MGGGGGGGARGRTAEVSRGSRAPGVTPRAPPTRSAPQLAVSPPITTYHHLFVVVWVGTWWVCGGWWRGAWGRTAVVSRGSRAPGVTPRAPPTRSAPQLAGSPPITTYVHCFVVVWVGTWWVGGGWWWWGARGRTTVVSRGSRAPGVTPRAPSTRSAPQLAGSPPITTYHHGVRSGPGEVRTILLSHIISATPSKQPLMVCTFLKVYMELGSYFLFLQEQIKDIIIVTSSFFFRGVCELWATCRLRTVQGHNCKCLWTIAVKPCPDTDCVRCCARQSAVQHQQQPVHPHPVDRPGHCVPNALQPVINLHGLLLLFSDGRAGCSGL